MTIRPLNFVPFPPANFIIAVQYWQGDEHSALRLARLIADIEPKYRYDVSLALVRRYDLEDPSPEALRTMMHVAKKMPVMTLRSERAGRGHPDGCNALWTGCVEQLAERYYTGDLRLASVFTCEADGVPLRTDWISCLQRAHAEGLARGKRVLGPQMAYPMAHVNGSLLMHLSVPFDHSSLLRTPRGQAWDIFHRVVLLGENYQTNLIENAYGSRCWQHEQLEPKSHEVAWLANTKDDTALWWAENSLVSKEH